MMYRGQFSTEFYRMLHRITHKKFRLWQGLDLLKHAVRHPSILNRRTVRRIAATAYHAATLPRIEARLQKLDSRPNEKA